MANFSKARKTAESALDLQRRWHARFAELSVQGGKPGDDDTREDAMQEYDEAKADFGEEALDALDGVVEAFQELLKDDAESLAERAYDVHADDCDVCCVLGGEFCEVGQLLRDAIELLEPVRIW